MFEWSKCYADPLKTQADDASLLCDEQLIETLEDKEYWLKLCPWLTISQSTTRRTKERALDQDRLLQKRDELGTNGFCHFTRQDLEVTDEEIDALVRGIIALIIHQWPPSFIYMYDEAWAVLEKQEGMLKMASGGNEFLGDVYVWYVDPSRGQRGWGPHRDRMGSGPESFREDSTPKLATTWFALSNATPNNSCLYVVPAQEDPYYHEQDLPDVDPLAAIFQKNPDAYQTIRALPCPRGCAWHFSHKIIHWGSFAQKPSTMDHQEPRIAMSWVVGDKSFEEPAFDRSLLPYPPIDIRLGFLMGQMIAYGGQTGLRKGFKNMCYRIFKRHAEKFTEFYRDKVEYIFYCRPPPPKEVHLKESTLEKPDPSTLEFYSPQEDAQMLSGVKGMFDTGDSSSSDDEV